MVRFRFSHVVYMPYYINLRNVAYGLDTTIAVQEQTDGLFTL
jgi:hypothetical protein